MAFSLTLANGGVLVIPDSSVNINVVSNPSGIATSGVIALVGEADEGPSWSQDVAEGNKLSANSYGPTDIARVTQKYGSGRLVDAFRGITSPSASNRIQGGPNRIILVKPNSSSKASYETADSHGEYEALRGGQSGNSIQVATSTSTAESAASTGNTSYVPSSSSASLKVRVNGGAEQTLSIPADTSPSSLSSSITGLSNLNAVGGVDRSSLSSLTGQNIEVEVVSGQNVNIKLATPNIFAGSPAAGDTVRIPLGSVIAGAADANVGWYLVTSVTNITTGAFLSAKKITTGAPVTVAPVAISATPANDMLDYSYMRIDNMSGTNRNILTGLIGQNITISVVSSALTATLAAGQVFASTPRSGDIVYIPSGSAYQGAGLANVGWYQVTTISNTTVSAFIQMSRLSNGLPVAVAITPIAAVTDLQDYDTQIKGIGKSLEIYDNAGTVNINTEFKQLGVDSAATWLQILLNSSSELQKTFTFTRNSTNSLETFVCGGTISMILGYNGTSATATIALSGQTLMLTTSVVGGSGGNLNMDLSKIATISDLVSKINANTGYSASVGSNSEGQKNPNVLDRQTFSIASSLGNRPGRVKRDLWDMLSSNSGLKGSGLVKYIATATSGLPEDNSATFLSNGEKGSTTGLQATQAIDALQGVRCNFVVPLMSQDAADDIAIGDTESGSTYSVDAINAAVKSHCLNMSTAKTKRHRLGLVSKKGSFAAAKASAATMSTYRIGHLFQDVIDLDSQGALKTFQPWMGAAKAASMQAAGVYKSIFNKNVNMSGVKHQDFDDENVSQVEDALYANMIPIQRQETGGFNFVSDQMTYGVDNNFVYNSLQAVYVADLMALSLAQSLKTAFVGESVADVTPGVVQSFVEAKMSEFLSLKFTVSSPQQGAPGGWKSISINITPGVLAVRVIAIEATSIYFIPIDLDIEGIKASNAA